MTEYQPAGGRIPRHRLLLVSTNYAPEHTGIGPYATQIAEHWSAEGHETHVLAGMPHYPSWSVDPGYRGRWRMTESMNGVSVHRRRHLVPSRQTAARRAMFEATVLGHQLAAPPRMGPPEAVFAQLPSLAGGVVASRLAARWRVPFVPVVQDLMGAAAEQSGISGGDRAASAASGVEGHVLRRATLVGVIHETFADRVVALGVDRGRIRVVPNWSHVAAPSADRAETRARLGWGPAPVVLHSGNMGLKQGLEVLVGAARLDPDVRWVLMGDGNQRAALQDMATGVPNVEFLPPVRNEEFPDVLAAADVLAVTQRASVLDMSVPSKLTSYFAAGRPVVASVADGGGTAEEVRRSGAGVLVEPEEPAALLEAVRKLAADPAAADALGAQGPRHVAAHLGREAGLARYDALLAEVLAGPVGTAAGEQEKARGAGA
ncbi:glycosyltransferase family 4 protein [Streptomyces abyssomicinicus]|uniref:glycosyltransferase family 4 protein n=1 Tax=Streptomyces abyssomicinicus TaxID=574929 RepID=UPI001FEBC9F0|nr:glycosyltransferase family 4 protein [Streptomyces abyssomicinicus]